MPQLPQLSRSVFRSTQLAPQATCPGCVQPVLHAPAEHICPLVQATPQAPQLLPSLIKLRHTPEQSVSPCWHTHAPPVQSCPDEQVMPQPPQLATFCVTSVQPLPQSIVLAAQAHVPLTQLCPAAQTWPHWPQFAGSVPRSTHPAPQVD
jgi:hypothetical protein